MPVSCRHQRSEIIDSSAYAALTDASLRQSVGQRCTEISAIDPLWRFAPARFVRRYSILGIPVEVATNAVALDEMSERTFGYWPTVSEGIAPAARVRAFLHDEADPIGVAGACPPIFRMQEPYFMLVSGATFAFADLAAGFAAAFVTRDRAVDAHFVRVAILECLALYLVSRYRRGALHAAAVVADGRCILLTGKCGAGKSTLAYACARAGLRLVSEDVVYVDEESEEAAVWGNPWYLRVPPESARFCPELAGARAFRELSGEHKILLDVERLWPGAAVSYARVDGILMLGRAAGPESSLGAADSGVVRDTLAHFRHGVSHEEGQAMLAAADRLHSLPTAELRVGSDLDQAVEVMLTWMAG